MTIKLAANLSTHYAEKPFEERFAAAAQSGFKGVEYLFPYEHPPQKLAELLQANGLTQVLFDFPAGDWAAGERGIAALPGRTSDFKEGVGKAMEYAKALDCKLLTVLAGRVPRQRDMESYEDTLITNLKYAAREAAKQGATVLLEALNTRDVPDFLVTSTPQVLELIRDANEPNIKMQYDVYHMQRQEGNLAETIAANAQMIAHYQIADNPGRGEPGTGEINYDFLLEFIYSQGYTGWIGCEYAPKTSTEEGLGWARKWLGA